MNQIEKIKLFNDTAIRAEWNAEEEDWYFVVVDVVALLSESKSPQAYWRKLKQRLKNEGNETVTNCHALKMLAADGKYRLTDVLNTQGILRLIQSIPSPNAEPFKIWLAKVGSERLDEIADPEKALQRGFEYYRDKGYSERWINQRLQSITIRKALTDEWKERGIDNTRDYAILTNEMTKAWSGLTVQEYKQFKNIKKESLRDNMTDLELTLNQLAEVSTTGISKSEKPKTFEENKAVAKSGGNIAKVARLEYEKRIKQSAISRINAKDKDLLEIENKNQD